MLRFFIPINNVGWFSTYTGNDALLYNTLGSFYIDIVV